MYGLERYCGMVAVGDKRPVVGGTPDGAEVPHWDH